MGLHLAELAAPSVLTETCALINGALLSVSPPTPSFFFIVKKTNQPHPKPNNNNFCSCAEVEEATLRSRQGHREAGQSRSSPGPQGRCRPKGSSPLRISEQRQPSPAPPRTNLHCDPGLMIFFFPLSSFALLSSLRFLKVRWRGHNSASPINRFWYLDRYCYSILTYRIMARDTVCAEPVIHEWAASVEYNSRLFALFGCSTHQ